MFCIISFQAIVLSKMWCSETPFRQNNDYLYTKFASGIKQWKYPTPQLSCLYICKSFKSNHLFQDPTFAKKYQKSTWCPKCQILYLDLWFRWIMCKSSWGVKLHIDSSSLFYAHEDIKVSSKVSSIYAHQILSEMSVAFRDSKWLSILLILIYCPTMPTFEPLIEIQRLWRQRCQDILLL